MRVESLNCSNCGAPLDVPGDVNLASCVHCGSRLRIHRKASGPYTEVLEKVVSENRRLQSEVELLQLQRKLRSLDEIWEAQRKELMHRDSEGELWEPSIMMAYLAYGGVCIAGVVALVLAVQGALSERLVWILVTGGVLGLGYGILSHLKAREYSREKNTYQTKRQHVLDQIAAAHRDSPGPAKN